MYPFPFRVNRRYVLGRCARSTPLSAQHSTAKHSIVHVLGYVLCSTIYISREGCACMVFKIPAWGMGGLVEMCLQAGDLFRLEWSETLGVL